MIVIFDNIYISIYLAFALINNLVRQCLLNTSGGPGAQPEAGK